MDLHEYVYSLTFCLVFLSLKFANKMLTQALGECIPPSRQVIISIWKIWIFDLFVSR